MQKEGMGGGPSAPPTVRVAVIMACFNRREKTLSCLRSLFAAAGGQEGLRLTVYLSDDASPDGTAEAVARQFPAVVVLHGSGSQYWCGGMRQAMAAAIASGPSDYYLWLNDDVLLFPESLRTLLHTADSEGRRLGEAPIVVGATRDPVSGKTSYGGRTQSRPLRPLYLDMVEPGDVPRRCTTMNGNCVLLPRSAVDRLGNLDPAFVHGLADWDYGLRATRAGVPIFLSPGHVGSCAVNPGPGAARAAPASPRAAWRDAVGPKAFPVGAWKEYTRRYGGPLWFFYWLRPYLVALVRGAIGAAK